MPSNEEIKSWPLKREAFTCSYTFVPPNPVMMQPKETFHIEKNFDFYVSPRKVIRYMQLSGKNYIYCDNFTFDTVMICTQTDSDPSEEGYDPEHPYKCEVDIKLQCHISKQFMF
jgi:hypothetical protein